MDLLRVLKDEQWTGKNGAYIYMWYTCTIQISVCGRMWGRITTEMCDMWLLFLIRQFSSIAQNDFVPKSRVPRLPHNRLGWLLKSINTEVMYLAILKVVLLYGDSSKSNLQTWSLSKYFNFLNYFIKRNLYRSITQPSILWTLWKLWKTFTVKHSNQYYWQKWLSGRL